MIDSFDIQQETFTEVEFIEYLEKGYIECKKSFFGRKTYEITKKGKKYLKDKLLDKLRYIQ